MAHFLPRRPWDGRFSKYYRCGCRHAHIRWDMANLMRLGWRMVGGLAAHGGGTSEDSCDYAGNWRSLLRVDYSPGSSLTPRSPPPEIATVLNPG